MRKPLESMLADSLMLSSGSLDSEIEALPSQLTQNWHMPVQFMILLHGEIRYLWVLGVL